MYKIKVLICKLMCYIIIHKWNPMNRVFSNAKVELLTKRIPLILGDKVNRL